MEGSGYLGADSKRVSGGNLMGCSEDFLIKGSPKKSGKDVDEKVLSILLKIVDLNPNSDEVLETIRISGFELDGIKDLLTKQHPELCNRNKNNSLIEKNSSKSSNSIVKSSVNNKNNGNNISFNINQNNLNNFNNSINNNNINNISSTDDNNQDNNNNSNDINNSDTLNNNHNNNNTLNNNNNNNNNSNNNINNNIDNKTNNNISLTNINETNNNSNKIVRGKPPGPPPTKSKLDIPFLGVGGSNDNQNIKGSSSKRAPPKAPPPLKLLNKCKSSILAKDSASESNKDNISKLSELDFGPSPPLGFEPKRLHWSVIPPNKIFGTIWEDIHFSNNNNDDLEKSKETNSDLNKHDEELLFDIKSILDQFFEDKTVLMEKLTLDCSNNISSNSSAKKYRMVLDSKRSQNIEIALKAMQLFDNNNELDISPIVEMLGYEKKTLQDGIDVFLKGVSKERLKILLDLYPTPEEIQLLNSINDRNIENLPLRSSEFFLVSILNLNRFKVRAQCVLSMKTFEEEYLSCLERLIKLEDAVVHIRSSLEKGGVLRLILHLILRIGNYLNHGTNRGKSFGFRFHSIELLKNVKTNNSKSNLLKYISKIVYDHSELMRQKIDIVSQACSEAAPIDITDVYKDIEELEKNIDFIKQELKLFSVKNDQLKVTKSSTTNNELSETNIGNSKSIKFENELQIPVFEVESSKEKTTDELYLNMVEKFVNDSSKQLEIAKKQLTEIINKLNELQFYAGETQSNNLNKVNNNSNIEIIKRCDMFFRLIKYEFNEFQIIEKKKKDREVRKLMGIKPSKSSENIKERMSDKNSFNNGNVKSNLRKSDLISEFSSTHEIENNIPSNQISDSSHQLLLEISNITLTSNSSTLSSTDSSCFQDQNKNKSDQEIQIEDLEHTPINKKNFNLSNSNSVSLHSGYDPITSSIHRCKKEFNNKCCQSNIYENGFSDLCNSKSNFHLQQNINSDINYKDVYQHQPICLKSFFDASSTTANIAARVYNSQIQDSNRSRKSHNQYSN